MLQFVAKILVTIFFVGIVGSLIVVVITFFEDLELLVEDESDGESGSISRRP